MDNISPRLSIEAGGYYGGGWKYYKCECGRMFFYPKDLEHEKMAYFISSDATLLEHPVHVIRTCKDRRRVAECPCWENLAQELAGESVEKPRQSIYGALLAKRFSRQRNAELLELNELALVD